MQFAVLGANENLLPLLRAALAGGSQCVATSELGRWSELVKSLAPDAIRDAPWELFIDEAPAQMRIGGRECRVDAVILALDHQAPTEERELRSEQLRKLAAAGMAMLVVLPACEGIVGYELDMIRHDTQVALFPYSPLAAHEGARRIQAIVQGHDDSLGEVEQLLLERSADVQSDAQRLEQFAADAHLLDCLLGGLREVSASSSREGTLEQLAAHVQGRDAVARWNLLRGPRKLKVTVLGSEGRVEWLVSDSPTSENAEQFGAGSWLGANEETTTLNDDGALAAWRAFESRELAAFPWDGGCRAVEAADHVPRSVRRGRAVAMQDQTPTEEDTFKGMMAAGSCGMLMLVLFVFIVWGVIESVRLPSQRSKFLAEREAAEVAGQPLPPIPRAPFWRRIWPVYPLAFLLALQLLRLVFPAPKPGREAIPAGNKSAAGDDEAPS